MPLVVAAAILDSFVEPSVLLGARRSAPKSLAGMWEFPGGKVEPGEDPESALRRELVEELGVAVEIGPLVPGPDADETWPIHQGHRMQVYLVTLATPQESPEPLQDHDELRWLPTGRWLSDVEWLPADRPIVAAVAQAVAVAV